MTLPKMIIAFTAAFLITACTQSNQPATQPTPPTTPPSTTPPVTPTVFTQTEFIIGTFVNPWLTTYKTGGGFVPGDLNEDSRRFGDVKAAGFNLLVYPPTYKLPFDQAKREIQIASEHGLRYMVNDSRFNIPAPYDETIANQIINDYKNLPSELQNTIFGYYLRDEPYVDADEPEIKSWIKAIKAKDPRKFGYVNLLPLYGFSSGAQYDAYLDSFLSPSLSHDLLPEVVSYDHYPLVSRQYQGSPGNSYFSDLRTLSAKAKAIGKPLWTYPVSVQYNKDLRPIDELYLRFTSFSPIVYGAKGLVYFTYGTYRPCPNDPDPTACGGTLGEAMIGADRTTKTPTYYWAQKINQYLRDVVGPVVMRSNHLGTYHNANYVYEGYGVTEAIPAQERIQPNTPLVSSFSDAKSNSMIGIFQDKTELGTYYVFVMNRAYEGSTVLDVTLNLKGDLTERVFETSIANPTLRTMSATRTGSDTRVVVQGLTPSEGRLIKISAK